MELFRLAPTPRPERASFKDTFTGFESPSGAMTSGLYIRIRFSLSYILAVITDRYELLLVACRARVAYTARWNL